uniref:Uncharacterized protein n=1 Tax=Setaria viridis TaxID=4556 RepID=A0A4U6W9R3_SETVI|nr:hypothetical protein SEVIR_1G134700v2 [Setaria viridis]
MRRPWPPATEVPPPPLGVPFPSLQPGRDARRSALWPPRLERHGRCSGWPPRRPPPPPPPWCAHECWWPPPLQLPRGRSEAERQCWTERATAGRRPTMSRPGAERALLRRPWMDRSHVFAPSRVLRAPGLGVAVGSSAGRRRQHIVGGRAHGDRDGGTSTTSTGSFLRWTPALPHSYPNTAGIRIRGHHCSALMAAGHLLPRPERRLPQQLADPASSLLATATSPTAWVATPLPPLTWGLRAARDPPQGDRTAPAGWMAALAALWPWLRWLERLGARTLTARPYPLRRQPTGLGRTGPFLQPKSRPTCPFL